MTDAVRSMPYGYSEWSISFLQHWNETFSQKKLDELTSLVNFHKLTYKVDTKIKEDKGNYYNRVLEIYKY